MRLQLLARYYQQYFQEAQPTIKHQEELIEQTIYHAPFVTPQQIFEDILPSIKSDKFFALSLVGPQGKGKTTLASIFATIARDTGFLIIYAKSKDMMVDLQQWIQKVKDLIVLNGTVMVCFVLDDMSYTNDALSKKQSALFKNFIADIRHVFEELLGSIEIFMIYNSHRLHSLPPMLRNSGTWIFTSMQSADREDMIKLISRRKEMREKLDTIYTFISQVSIDGPKYGKLQFNFGGNKTDFVWGTKENPGDGRLMVSYHAGDIKVFAAKIVENMIKVDSDEYHVKCIPVSPLSEEEISAKREADFRNNAMELTALLNNPDKSEGS